MSMRSRLDTHAQSPYQALKNPAGISWTTEGLKHVGVQVRRISWGSEEVDRPLQGSEKARREHLHGSCELI